MFTFCWLLGLGVGGLAAATGRQSARRVGALIANGMYRQCQLLGDAIGVHRIKL